MLLIGIVKKNAIMMVDFALHAERNEGKSPREAIYEACLLRFRPILMTTLAAMLAGVPLMLGGGMGSELRAPLGLAIVGRFQTIDPLAIPACLVAGHAPFVWGRTPHEAAHNAVVLEAVARMAYRTLTLRADAGVVTQSLLDRHYHRKHGPKATYGQ